MKILTQEQQAYATTVLAKLVAEIPSKMPSTYGAYTYNGITVSDVKFKSGYAVIGYLNDKIAFYVTYIPERFNIAHRKLTAHRVTAAWRDPSIEAAKGFFNEIYFNFVLPKSRFTLMAAHYSDSAYGRGKKIVERSLAAGIFLYAAVWNAKVPLRLSSVDDWEYARSQNINVLISTTQL